MRLFTICLMLAAAMLLAGCHTAAPVANGPQEQATQTPLQTSDAGATPLQAAPPVQGTPVMDAAAQADAANDRYNQEQFPDATAKANFALQNFISPEEKVQLATATGATRDQILANARDRQNTALDIRDSYVKRRSDNATMGKSLQRWSISSSPDAPKPAQ